MEASEQTEPYGFVSFISALIKLKLPYHLYKSGDSISVRDQLLLLDLENSNDENNIEENKNLESNSVTNENQSPVAVPKLDASKKRRREEDDNKSNDEDLVEEKKLKRLRRSLRLNKEIAKAWETFSEK